MIRSPDNIVETTETGVIYLYKYDRNSEDKIYEMPGEGRSFTVDIRDFATDQTLTLTNVSMILEIYLSSVVN